MINKSILTLLVLSSVAGNGICGGKGLPKEGSTFSYGQQPPGKVGKPFDLTVIPSQDWQLGEVKGNALTEFYLTPSKGSPFDPTVIVFRKESGEWKQHNFHAALSGNPDVLHNKSNYIERTAVGWSKIKSLGAMFNREDWGIMRLSTSGKGTYVFDDWKSNDVIRISRVKDGKREQPKLLPKHINTGEWTAHPFIAHDESYLIWDSEREEGLGDSDLYISFLQKDGSWGAAINLGEKVNSDLEENGAMVTSDGKYLVYSRSEEKFREDGSAYWVSQKYWVDAQIIEDLRPKL